MSAATPRLTPRLLLAQLSQSMAWLFEADRTSALGLVVLTVVLGLIPTAMAWVGRAIIDGVVLAAKTGAEADRRAALTALAAELGLAITLLVLRRVQAYWREALRIAVARLLNQRILEKALTLELAQFEDAATYDVLLNAQREASGRPLSLALSALSLVKAVLTLTGFGVLLWGPAWWSVLLLAAASVPEFLAETRLSGDAFRLISSRARESRLVAYLEQVLTRDQHVKEVKLYELGPLVVGRHSALLQKFQREDLALAWRKLTLGSLFAGLSSLAFYVCYAAVGLRAVQGLISVGDLTLSISAFRQGQGAFDDVLSAVSGMYEDALFVSNLVRYFELPEGAAGRAAGTRTLPEGRFSVEFDRVSFRYPGQEAWAIEDLTLTLGPGERLAVVGENGAGKSTLVKLLLGLYQPTRGVIRYGGLDGRELEPRAFRERVGAVFQDFVRYQLSAGENVGLGDLPRLGDGPAIEHAAADGGASEVLEGLPGRRDAVLGSWFEDGHDLSGGQWQKLAIARAFMRLTSRGGAGADLLILDEPTAAIDAAAEAALFERFQRFTAGRSALIISHRFSTVRIADRIAVLEHGRLLELGSHEALVARGGRYAELFTLQARGYR